MNGQPGQHASNPAMLAAYQQQQQQFNQFANPSTANAMNMNMNANQQQQLQQMLAAKYGAGMGGPGSSGAMNPQMLQAYQQHQQQQQGGGGSGSMGVNPQALMNQNTGMSMGGGMNMASSGSGGMGMGMNGRGGQISPQQMFNQQQRASAGGGMGSINPAQLLASQSQNMNGMGGGGGGGGGTAGGGGGGGGMTGMMGMGGGMGGMGGINPQVLSANASGSQNQNVMSSPPASSAQLTSINPSALSNATGGMNHNNASGMSINNLAGMTSMSNMNMSGMPSLQNLRFTPQQLHQLSMMTPEDRNKAMQRAMMTMQHQIRQQQQQQQQLDQGMDGMGMGINHMQGMGGVSIGGNNTNMRGLNNMQMGNMGGMQGLNPAQMAQMQMMSGQSSGQQSQQQHTFERPPSSASQIHPSQQGQMSQQSPTQPQAPFPHHQSQSPARSQTPHQHGQGQQQHHGQLQQQNMNANMMMPPPSSIPPRPPTTAPSPAPRSGTSTGIHPSMQQQYMQGHMQSPRPGTSGSGGQPAPASRTGSALGMHPQQQMPQGSHMQTPGQNASAEVPAPQPLQPKPTTATAAAAVGGVGRGSPAPPQRPGTSQSQHGGQQRSMTPVQMGSRPGTASGFRPQGPGQAQMQQQAGPMQGQSPVNQQQPQQLVHTPYPSIAPAPISAPDSPRTGIKRKVSGTPAPGTPIPGQQPQPGQGDVVGMAGQVQIPGQMPQMTPRMSLSGSSGLPMPGNMNMNMNNMNLSPAQLANMRMSGPGGASQMMNNPNLMPAGGGGGGMMAPPGLPRAQSQGPDGVSLMNMNMNGMNGMQTPGLHRQASLGDLRNIPANMNMNANAANLSINTNINPAMGVGLGVTGPVIGPGNAMSVPNMNVPMVGTPTNIASPNPALLASGSNVILPTMDGIVPSTPRQSSLPPSMGSPFPPGAMMNMGPNGLERKMSSQGVLGGAPPITRASTGDMFNGPPSAPLTASSAMAPTPSLAGVGPPPNVPAISAAPASHQLPPLPANVNLNPKVTRVQIVSLIDSATTIPPLTEDEIADVQRWMKADKDYEAMYRKMREGMVDDVRELVVKTRTWWEKDPMEDPRASRRRRDKFDIIGLKSQRDERLRRPRTGKREGFRLPRAVKDDDASRPEQLVPIRLEFDVDHHKMRDTFVWNLNDPVITPEIFAQSVVDDYSLAPSYVAVIAKTIQDQLSDYKAHSAALLDDDQDALTEDIIVNGTLEEEELNWWDAWRNNVRSDGFAKLPDKPVQAPSRKKRKVVKDEAVEPQIVPPPVSKDQPMSIEDFEEDDSQATEEMRILVKLDIIVGPVKLEDQIEWDIDSPDPAPEYFAEVYAKELGLGGEFKTAIAHSIREQVQIYQKSLFLVGHPSDGSAVQDDDLRMSLLPSLSTGARSMDQVIAFTPQLNYLSDSEIERNEKERERELNRRKRKLPRGRRGVALPDREAPKTFRTPAIGFPEIDPATLALVQAAAAPTSRRAAAAAASLTIANMVASENGTTILPQATPTPSAPAVPTQPKEKKPKGLMKAPSLPPTVLKPRAHVKAPTPSTAAESASVPPPPIANDLPLPSSAPENRGARVPLSAKRAKELEREAKEREYVDGQHPNQIDGVWHCSNCGCPDHIAIGRRKGPLGDKSQCGACGKFWHRHRRPRPVEYNSSAEFHLNLKRQEEEAKLNASRKKRPQSHAIEASSSKAPTVEPETPSKPKSELFSEAPPMSMLAPPEETNPPPVKPERPASAMSTASSTSEAPLAQVVKTNGTSHPPPSTAAEIAAPAQDVASDQAAETSSNATPGTPNTPATAPPAAPAATAPPVRPGRIAPPAWLTAAIVEMQERYPDDKFEALLPRKSLNSNAREWRIKCLDCPGKLYTPGPGETLTNYEVHLKNRQHRQKVNSRLAGDQS